MRYLPATLGLMLAVGLAGCGAGVTLPPVAPDEVEIFMPGSFPTEDYKVLAPVEEEVPLNVPDQDLIDQARAKAASLGADALLISAIRRTTEGGVAIELGQEQQKRLEGLAVYYPGKHPELSNK